MSAGHMRRDDAMAASYQETERLVRTIRNRPEWGKGL